VALPPNCKLASKRTIIPQATLVLATHYRSLQGQHQSLTGASHNEERLTSLLDASIGPKKAFALDKGVLSGSMSSAASLLQIAPTKWGAMKYTSKNLHAAKNFKMSSLDRKMKYVLIEEAPCTKQAYHPTRSGT